ncbi:MAG: Crp/Fnr family transcriptional regulator [Hyphomicrobiaceae bacterium]
MVGKARARVNSCKLVDIPILAGVAALDLKELEQNCTVKKCEAGEEILGYLEQGDDVYFVLSGAARVIIYSAAGKAVGFRELGPGDMFGEYAAIDGGVRSASIEAETDCVVLIMPSSEFKNLLFKAPTVAFALLQHFTQQLRLLTKRVYEFSTLAVNNRIQAELLRLARDSAQNGQMDRSAARLFPSPKHADIAARVSTHREAVTRHLGQLTRDGIVERQGRALLIKDVVRLEQMVRQATGE